MRKLTPADLLGLERYAVERARLRLEAIAHKRDRRVAVGPHLTWCFEDRSTVLHQVQEMLRAERIFEPADIEAELAAYNPLIPDGRNWKATMFIEYPDPIARREALERLVGIEHRCWVRIGAQPAVFAIADEDLERSTPQKTSAVHFLRFELAPGSGAALDSGAPLAFGVSHPAYEYSVDPVPKALRESLRADLD